MEQVATPTAWIELPASWGDPARRFVFGAPLSVWQADALAEVKPALERVAQEQRAGNYVVGFLSYESAPAFDPAMTTPLRGPLPYAWFAAFSEQLSASSFILHPSSFLPSSFILHPSSFTTREQYVAAVNSALAHIRAGDIYQVNYTVRAILSPSVYGGDRGGPFALFQTLLAAAPMPHASYVSPRFSGGTKGGQIISLSPELFLRKRSNILESRPMKGTAKREPSWAADEAARLALSRDEKNRAENVMIVDLVRNDLGRVCKMGSVTVPELWRVDRFPTVHQMTSLVRGELRDDVSLFDIFAALFPPGSVTGAPKIRAMEIIAELEPQPRGIYCGTIGIFFPNGDFECNVAIRTLEVSPPFTGGIKGGRSSFIPHPSLLGLGSGIVADSDPEVEWNETQLKGQFVTLQPRDFLLYETIRYDKRMKDEGGMIKEVTVDAHGSVPSLPSLSASSFILHPSSFLDLHLHLRRLRQSALYFNRPFPLKEIIQHLRELQLTLGDEPARIKLDLHMNQWQQVSSLTSQVSDSAASSFILHPSSFIETHVIREFLSWPEGGMTLMLSDLRLDPGDFRLYHKTNLRPEKYEELEQARALGGTEVLFLNIRGELTEGALSNIALKLNNEWLTPALSCGLLPGTWREKQLAGGRWREAVLTLDDLKRAEEIRIGNAVRGEGKVNQIILPSGKLL